LGEGKGRKERGREKVGKENWEERGGKTSHCYLDKSNPVGMKWRFFWITSSLAKDS